MGLREICGLKKEKKKSDSSPLAHLLTYILLEKKFVWSFCYECQVEIQSSLCSLLNFSLKQMCSKELMLSRREGKGALGAAPLAVSPAARSGCCPSLQELWETCFAAPAMVALGNQAPSLKIGSSKLAALLVNAQPWEADLGNKRFPWTGNQG